MENTNFAVDVFGKAVLDYQWGNYTEDILTFSSLDEKDIIPLPYLFRDFDNMPLLEQKALDLCKGKVLDIGCGAGSHSLYLQGKGLSVTALDSSKGAIETCGLRGIKNSIHTDIYSFKGPKFDTLLLLMNGIGLAGRLNQLGKFLEHLKLLLKPNGHILLDSSDIIYMFQEDDDGGHWIPDTDTYYGEVEFTMTYKNIKSKPFPWLYLDYNSLERAAFYHNLNCKLVSQGEHYDYLAKLSLKRQQISTSFV
ncbi:MAG: class I SAM-dependent methyltransferase [Saonia sp.]